MSTADRNASPLRNTWSTFWSAPLLFVFLQVPVGIVSMMESLLSPSLETNLAWALLILVPISLIAQPVCSSLTFLAVRDLGTPQGGDPADWMRTVGARFKPLIAAAVLSETVCGLGMMTLVPGIYYTAMYLFIPQLVVSEPKLPWSVYLLRSRKLARQQFGRMIGITLLLILLGAGSYLGIDTAGRNLPSGWAYSNLLLLLGKALLSMLAATWIDIFISHCFLQITAIRNVATEARPA